MTTEQGDALEEVHKAKSSKAIVLSWIIPAAFWAWAIWGFYSTWKTAPGWAQGLAGLIAVGIWYLYRGQQAQAHRLEVIETILRRHLGHDWGPSKLDDLNGLVSHHLGESWERPLRQVLPTSSA